MRRPLVVLMAFTLALTACASPTARRQVVRTSGAPAAIGPYSQAVRHGDLLFASGQLGADPVTGKIVEGGIEAETRQALENLRAVVRAAGFSLGEAVQAQVYLADMDNFAAMNRVYAEYFPVDPPARMTVQVARLPRDGRVEIALILLKR